MRRPRAHVPVLLCVRPSLGLCAALLSLAGCFGPSARCEAICDWYLEYCEEDRDVCLEDCAEADPEVVDEAEQCLEDTPSSCRAASCCIEFAYDATNFERECL